MLIYLPAHRPSDWFWLGMIAVFFIIYVLVAEIPRWWSVTIPLELIVTGAFSIFGFNNYMIIFPAWQVSFLLGRRTKRHFIVFAMAYELILIGGLIRFNSYHPGVLTMSNPDIEGLFFPVASPFLAYVFSRSMWQRRSLNQTNRRLEAIIQRDERERIARDLHDTLGQSFSMITIKTELAKKLLTKAPKQVPAELDDIAAVSRKNLQLVRQIVNDLHDQSISEVLLNQDQQLEDAGVELQTVNEDRANNWPSKTQAQLAAVITEATTNVIRHAHAQEVRIVFEETDVGYRVQLSDDGHGGQYTRSGSNGMTGMQSRMQAAGGQFTIQGNNNGTLIILLQPKENG
ncbi:sensor histidine kinase [Levilactobacillus bambusae]|uniref:histidine kinase n=1 Tax=Levilactobacillus bambusae TaxID=2024736 RepID=A0A2V1N3V0_9LACO|nr:sensor histidine kinase [Levilactobacillus bambusae]PWG00610.1 two-component sensor histidine kinase [Levilactobacillus bambusae]